MKSKPDAEARQRRAWNLRSAARSVATTATETTAAAAGATTTTAAATTETTTATGAATTTAATAAKTATARLLRTSLVDRQVTTVATLAIEGRNGCLRLLIGRHFDKTETLGAACFTIHDHLGRSHSTEFAKDLFQTTLIYAVGQIAHIKLSTQLTRSIQKGGLEAVRA